MIRDLIRRNLGVRAMADSIDDHGYGTLAAFVEVFGSMMTAAGVSMDPDRAMQISTVHGCVVSVSETLATLPLILYRRLPDGGKVRATDHPLYHVLRTRPNPLLTSSEFRSLLQRDIETHGNGYALRVEVGGRLEELLYVPAERMRPVGDGWGASTYHVRSGDGRVARAFTSDEVLHVRGPFGKTAVEAIAPCVQFRELFGLAWALEAYVAYSFANGARLSGALEAPGKLSDKSRANLIEWFARYEGVKAAGRTMLLEEGLKYSKYQQTHEEARVVEMTEKVDAKVARVYRVPLHMISTFVSQPRANMEQQGQEFVSMALRSRAVRLEERIAHSLLPPGDELFTEHLFEALERGDLSARMNAYVSGVNSGIYSRNEVRAKENMNPYPAGDAYLQPLNMTTAGSSAAARLTSEDHVTSALQRFAERVRSST